MRTLEVSSVFSLLLRKGNRVLKDGDVLKNVPFPTRHMTCPERLFRMNEQVPLVRRLPTGETPGRPGEEPDGSPPEAVAAPSVCRWLRRPGRWCP